MADTSTLVLSIQRRLREKGHDLGTSGPARDGVDGDLGSNLDRSKTLQAVAREIGVTAAAETEDPGVPDGLAKPDQFFGYLREGPILGPVLTGPEVSGCNAILTAVAEADWPVSWAAYALATAYHETAGTMQPIREYGGPSYLRRNYDVTGANPARAKKHGNVNPGDGIRYCGRGYVQLTWHCNYDRAGRALGVDLVRDPDAALQPDVAAKVMVRGMSEGWFCNKKCADFLPKTGPARPEQFREARRIINGQDKARKIADYALIFQEALLRGGWN